MSVTPTPFKWPGGKARFAREIAMKLIEHIPYGGLYYEAFGGGMSVAVEVGCLRPDITIYVSETNFVLVQAMREIQKHGQKMGDQVIAHMAQLIHKPMERDGLLQRWGQEGNPYEWIAAMNCRFNGNLNNHNWNPDQRSVKARLGTIRSGLGYYKRGLANAQILMFPAYNEVKAHAAYFDPPYFLSVNMYPGQKGSDAEWAALAHNQKKYSRYVLVSNFDTARSLYFDFTMKPIGRQLAFKGGGTDCLFEWRKVDGSNEPKPLS